MGCSNCNPSEKFNELDSFISGIEDRRGALIAVLHKAQHLYGYLSDEVIYFISEKLDIPTSKIYGVIKFYSYFTTTPRGKYVVNVCLGTACFVRGADAIMKEFEKQLNLKAGETSSDMKFTLSGLRCVGACGLAPVVMINDKVYGRVEKEQIIKILEECK
ncbi:MAG: putative Fe hydrogenase, electron-transfer subunit [Firmicutes bacterium]|nr:putative Fe hydrogenase, electron-transfer subunit [Bacillota bacterium]